MKTEPAAPVRMPPVEGEALKPSELLQDFHLVDTVNGVIAKFLLNAEELVVFRDSV